MFDAHMSPEDYAAATERIMGRRKQQTSEWEPDADHQAYLDAWGEEQQAEEEEKRP